MIKIKSKRPGFRRCGMAHPAEWTEYPDDRFSAGELARLEAEPMLTVVRAVREDPPASAPDVGAASSRDVARKRRRSAS
jgi:hypothetical protein